MPFSFRPRPLPAETVSDLAYAACPKLSQGTPHRPLPALGKLPLSEALRVPFFPTPLYAVPLPLSEPELFSCIILSGQMSCFFPSAPVLPTTS